jgi:selenide,water dikinase
MDHALNTPGEALGEMPRVHALTDVTGFGLAGHLLEICRGSQLAAQVDSSSHSDHSRGARLGKTGRRDRRFRPQLEGYGHEVEFRGEAWQQKLLSDPQTSGGLLVACAPEPEKSVLEVSGRRASPRRAPSASW